MTGNECGLPPALSVTTTLAPLFPLLVGFKRILIVHVPPGSTAIPTQEVTGSSRNSLGLLPAKVTLDKTNAALPELVTSTLCTVLVVPTTTSPNVGNKAGLNPTDGAAVTPVPVTKTSTGESAFPTTCRIVDTVPNPLGVKATLILQLPPAGIATHPSGAATKLLAAPPTNVTLLRLKGASPVFWIVRICPALVTPIG